MSDLVTARDSIVTKVSALIPFRSCRGHHSPLDKQELDKLFLAPPSCAIVCLGTSDSRETGGVLKAQALWAAYVVAKAPKPRTRGDAAMSLADFLLRVIANERWDNPAFDAATKVQARNMAAQVDEDGLALWVITWSQSLDLDVLDNASLTDLAEILSTYNVDSGAEADNTKTLTELQS